MIGQAGTVADALARIPAARPDVAMLAGASGYVVKDVKGMQLIGAIKDVAAGRSLLDQRATAALMQRLRTSAEDRADPLAQLSAQHRRVLELLGEGLTNRQIAERMVLTEKTVKNYVSRVLNTLGLQHRTQAALLAAELHLG